MTEKEKGAEFIETRYPEDLLQDRIRAKRIDHFPLRFLRIFRTPNCLIYSGEMLGKWKYPFTHLPPLLRFLDEMVHFYQWKE